MEIIWRDLGENSEGLWHHFSIDCGTIFGSQDPTHSKRISIPNQPLGGFLEHVACLLEVVLEHLKAVFEHREVERIKQKQNTTTKNKTQKQKTSTHKDIQHTRNTTTSTKTKPKPKKQTRTKPTPTTKTGFEQEPAGTPGTVQGPHVAFWGASGGLPGPILGPVLEPFWDHL